MRVLEIASEAVPFAKTGGLADVAGALPDALAGLGCEISLVIPAYAEALGKGLPIEPTGIEFDVPIGTGSRRARILRCRREGHRADVYLVANDDLFDRPALYGSAQMLVDEELRPLGPTAPWPAGASFRGALTENIITGCTAALNAPAVRLLKQAGAAPNVRFHDWWCYLVISAFGQVIFDNQPSLLYRQHGRNHIGHGAGWWGRQRQIVRFLLRNDWVGILLAQVEALDFHYGAQLPAEARGLLDRYFVRSEAGWLPGWALVFSLRRWRHHWFGELALRVLLGAYRLRLWPLPGRRVDTLAGRTEVP